MTASLEALVKQNPRAAADFLKVGASPGFVFGTGRCERDILERNFPALAKADAVPLLYALAKPPAPGAADVAQRVHHALEKPAPASDDAFPRYPPHAVALSLLFVHGTRESRQALLEHFLDRHSDTILNSPINPLREAEQANADAFSLPAIARLLRAYPTPDYLLRVKNAWRLVQNDSLAPPHWRKLDWLLTLLKPGVHSQKTVAKIVLDALHPKRHAQFKTPRQTQLYLQQLAQATLRLRTKT